MAHAAGGRRPPAARPAVVALVVAAVLVGLSVLAAVGWRARTTDDGRQAFLVDAATAQQVVVDRLQLAVGVLGRTQGVVAEPDATDASDFERGVAAALPEELASVASVALVESVPRGELDELIAARRAAGLPELDLRSVERGGAPPAVVTFEASTRGAPILQGFDVRTVPELAAGLRASTTGGLQLTSRLTALPASVVRVHPDLGRSALALLEPAGPDRWLLVLLSGDELAAQSAAVDDELTVGLAVGPALVGASSVDGDGAALDLAALEPDRRVTRPVTVPGGPLLVTVADVDGVAGGGWREPGLLLGAGVALSVLFASLVYVLARSRAGALAVASRARAAQARSEQSLAAVVQNLTDLVVVTDPAGAVDFVAPSVRRLLGRDQSAVRGRMLEDLVHPDDRGLLAVLAAGHGVSEKGLIRMRHSDGAYRSFDVVVVNRLDDPAIEGLVLTGHDVTERVEQADKLSHDATHDALTGLPNRTLLRDRLEHALVRAQRTGDGVAVVFCDLDKFKGVNDTHGHQAGDELLTAVARRLRAAARAMDTVGRWAGDEFVVVCEDVDGPAAAHLVAERLHEAVALPVDLGPAVVDVGMSVGVALAEPGERADDVLDRADRAMYRAKVTNRPVIAA